MHAMKAYVGIEVYIGSTHSYPQNWVGVRGEVHALTASPLAAGIESEAGWAP